MQKTREVQWKCEDEGETSCNNKSRKRESVETWVGAVEEKTKRE